MKLASKQKYKNITVFPITNKHQNDLDFLDLKTGFDMGIVFAEECEESQVGNVNIINRSVAPLLLLDGEEIVGCKQNRIINKTMILPPQSTKTVPVSCSEQNRWSYTSEFKHSEYIANFSTRSRKLDSQYKHYDTQNAVWNSIRHLDASSNTHSETKALRDSYIKNENLFKKLLKSFKLKSRQKGLLIAVDGKISGIELFCNDFTYKKYHQMILKSFMVENSIDKNEKSKISKKEASNTLNALLNLPAKKEETLGLGEFYRISNSHFNGSILNLNGNLVHSSYLAAI